MGCWVALSRLTSRFLLVDGLLGGPLPAHLLPFTWGWVDGWGLTTDYDMKNWLIYFFLFISHGTTFAEPVTVYAAASLTSALQDVSKIAELRGVALRLSFASSSILAKQIAMGAPADVYFSANVKWMDFLADENLIEPDTRIDLLGNALVVIAPKGEQKPWSEFRLPASGTVALGDPSHVPAGMYARDALKKLGWWDVLKNRMAPAMDVRGALALVARGECALGIVYATDAAISTEIEILATLPDSLLNTSIAYPIAIVKGRRTPSVNAAMALLQSATAAAVFQRYGFRVLPIAD